MVLLHVDNICNNLDLFSMKKRLYILVVFYDNYFSLVITLYRSKHVALNDVLSCIDCAFDNDCFVIYSFLGNSPASEF